MDSPLLETGKAESYILLMLRERVLGEYNVVVSTKLALNI